jgi:hypothetical protein
MECAEYHLVLTLYACRICIVLFLQCAFFQICCRWGPNVCQTACILQHVEKQSGRHVDCAPLIGGVETDLANLLRGVEKCGGLEQVIDNNKWNDVVKFVRLPKAVCSCV